MGVPLIYSRMIQLEWVCIIQPKPASNGDFLQWWYLQISSNFDILDSFSIEPMVLGIPHFKKPTNGYSYNRDSNINYIMTIYDVIRSSMSLDLSNHTNIFHMCESCSATYSRI